MNKNYRFFTYFLLFIMTFFVFTGCNGKDENTASHETAKSTTYPLTVTDGLDNEVVLKAKPQRIVSVTLMTDELLLSIANPKNVLGLTTFSDDPSLSNIADRSGVIANKVVFNVETLIGMEPDLVFLADWTDPAGVQQLRDADIPVYQVKTPLTLDDVKILITELGTILGEPKGASALNDWIDGKLRVVTNMTSNIPDDKRPVIMDYSTWGSSFGKGSSWDYIVTSAGLINGVGDYEADQWGTVALSKEKLLEIDPDILILPGWIYGDPQGADNFFKEITEDPALGTLKAVQSGNVYKMPEHYKSATSQYMVYGIEYLAKLAFPNYFNE